MDETNPLHNFFFPNPEALQSSLQNSFQNSSSKFSSLNFALLQLIEEFDMVNFIPLNVRNESSLAAVLSHIDNATQYAENLEPKDPDDCGNGNGNDEYNEENDEDIDDDNYDDYESNLDNID